MRPVRRVLGILKQCLLQALTGSPTNRREVDQLLKERDEEIEHLDRRREMLLRRRELRSRMHDSGRGQGPGQGQGRNYLK